MVLLGHNVHPNTSPLVDGPQFLHLENEGLDFIVKISSNAHNFILLEIQVGLSRCMRQELCCLPL